MMVQLLLLGLALVVPSLGARLPYIIGGKDADISEWPWQCSLGIFSSEGYSHYCGASVISSTWLVTAAHCIYSPSSLGIRCGSSRHASGGVLRHINEAIVHEKFGEGAGLVPNDIAVIRVDPLPLSSTIKVITMATTEEAGNSDCYITGWGYTTVSNKTRPEDSLPSILQEALVQVYTNSECRDNWGSEIDAGNVCIGDDARTKGSCNEDSGGPLVCKVGSEYQLLGVTSWGNQNCSPRDLSVYTRIPYFRSWVRGKTGI